MDIHRFRCPDASSSQHVASDSDGRCYLDHRYRNDVGFVHGLSFRPYLWEVRLGPCKFFTELDQLSFWYFVFRSLLSTWSTLDRLPVLLRVTLVAPDLLKLEMYYPLAQQSVCLVFRKVSVGSPQHFSWICSWMDQVSSYQSGYHVTNCVSVWLQTTPFVCLKTCPPLRYSFGHILVSIPPSSLLKYLEQQPWPPSLKKLLGRMLITIALWVDF